MKPRFALGSEPDWSVRRVTNPSRRAWAVQHLITSRRRIPMAESATMYALRPLPVGSQLGNGIAVMGQDDKQRFKLIGKQRVASAVSGRHVGEFSILVGVQLLHGGDHAVTARDVNPAARGIEGKVV